MTFVGLRFPNQPATVAEVIERRTICATAQRQHDAGEPVTAPEGVEIVLIDPNTVFINREFVR